MNRLLTRTTGILLGLLLCQQALALSPENSKRLSAEFASQGRVELELMAPLGAPELGVALIDKGAADFTLLVLRVGETGGIETVISESFPRAQDNQHPLTLFYNGSHLLTYAARDWEDENGFARLRGDVTVRDIGDQGDRSVLFLLRDVVDLKFVSDGVRSDRNLLWQPADHFLNNPGKRPYKHSYFRLAFDPVAREYNLFNHLTLMSNSVSDEAANLNNRAILYYERGEMREASKLLSQAWTSVGFNPVTIQSNQDLVKGEIEDLEYQTTLDGDDALMYFWTGDWTACLRVLSAREASGGLTNLDLAMTGICYAYLKRWPEADYVSVELTRRQVPFLGDYFSEMARVVSYQTFENSFEVEGNYLMSLAQIDPTHPGLPTGKARLLRRQGEFGQAKEILEEFLWSPNTGRHNMSRSIAELSSIYNAELDLDGLAWLETVALEAPVKDLSGYVAVVDYRDLSSSMVDVEYIPSESGIGIPREMLDLLKDAQ